MKKIKKILMGVTAIAMAFSMTAMTACVEGNTGDTGNTGNESTTPGGETPGGETPGGETPGGETPGGETPGGETPGGETPGGETPGGETPGGETPGGETPGGETPGGETPGGETPGGETPGGETPGGETPVTKTDAQKVMEAFGKQSFKAYGVSHNQSEKNSSVSYSCDKAGVMLDGATKQEYYFVGNETGDQKINLKNFEMDMNSHTVSQPVDKDGNPVKDGSGYEDYYYSFIRGGYTFDVSSEKPVTDFSKVTFSWYGGAMSEEMLALLALMPEDGVPAQLFIPVSAVLNLADIYGAASFKDKKLTVNFNKVAYKLYNDVLKVIEDLDENTTVGDIIKATPVKNLFESLTYGIDAKEVYDQLYAYAVESGAVPKAQLDAMLLSVPKPEAGENIYAYLVRLFESKDVAVLLNALASDMGIVLPEDTAVADMKVSEVITLIMGMIGGNQPDYPDEPSQGENPGGETPVNPPVEVVPVEPAPAPQMEVAAPSMAEIREYVKELLGQLVTVTEDKITINTGEDGKTEVSALELVFNVGDDYSVSSVSFNAEVAVNYSSFRNDYEFNDDKEPTLVYEKTEGETSLKVTGTVEFKTEEYTLTDISKANVEERKYEIKDGAYYSDNDLFRIQKYDEEKEEKSEVSVLVGVTIENGDIKSIDAYTRGNSEEATPEIIGDCDWTGEELTFSVEGVEGNVKCEVRVEVEHGPYGIYVIRVTVYARDYAQADGYYVDGDQAYTRIDSEEKTTTKTVEEILAQAE